MWFSESIDDHLGILRRAGNCRWAWLLLLTWKTLILAGATLEPSSMDTSPPISKLSRRSFPPGFVFGTATSAYQVEGAYDTGGRGSSIWDTFSHEPGHIMDGSNGNIADDEYNRFQEDVELMANFSVDAYRFSISWSRIYPNGKGDVNQDGINHYNSLINALLIKGIQPFVTLYHWDLPQALQDDYNGWLSTQIVNDFAAYAETCFKMFGDRVKHWITFNEPHSFASQGYAGYGLLAPGRCSGLCRNGNSKTEPYIVGHNVLLSHAAAVKIYREKYKPQQSGNIGITLDSKWYEPLTGSTNDIAAANRSLDFELGWFLDPIIFGDYPQSMRENVGNRLPSFTNVSTMAVKGSWDFIGINHYTTYYAQDSNSSVAETVLGDDPDSHSLTPFIRNGKQIGRPSAAIWLYVVPWGMKKLMDYIRVRYNNPTIFITENGYCDPNNPFLPLQDALQDNNRISYHSGYLSNLLSAIRDGSDVRGYFVWSLLDNWEWNSGFSVRFGLHFVDYHHNLTRYPKASVKWFRELLQHTPH
eukprot:c30054_g1_i1 orf=231-1817(+)